MTSKQEILGALNFNVGVGLLEVQMYAVHGGPGVHEAAHADKDTRSTFTWSLLTSPLCVNKFGTHSKLRLQWGTTPPNLF